MTPGALNSAGCREGTCLALNRREFLGACGAAAALGLTGVSMTARAAETGTRKHWMIDELTKELFEKHVGETFTVTLEEGSVATPLRLASVKSAPERMCLGPDGKPFAEMFSLMFEGAKETALAQHIYTFDHAGMGTFAVFLVPVVSPSPEVKRYEEAFSRMLRTI